MCQSFATSADLCVWTCIHIEQKELPTKLLGFSLWSDKGNINQWRHECVTRCMSAFACVQNWLTSINTNNATHYVKVGKTLRESSTCNYCITSPRAMIIKAIFTIVSTLEVCKKSLCVGAPASLPCLPSLSSFLSPPPFRRVSLAVSHTQIRSLPSQRRHSTLC